eukprot:484298-Amphidinium_carterae.2
MEAEGAVTRELSQDELTMGFLTDFNSRPLTTERSTFNMTELIHVSLDAANEDVVVPAPPPVDHPDHTVIVARTIPVAAHSKDAGSYPAFIPLKQLRPDHTHAPHKYDTHTHTHTGLKVVTHAEQFHRCCLSQGRSEHGTCILQRLTHSESVSALYNAFEHIAVEPTQTTVEEALVRGPIEADQRDA